MLNIGVCDLGTVRRLGLRDGAEAAPDACKKESGKFKKSPPYHGEHQFGYNALLNF